jgi:uncharacterized protein YbjT (DUF2867 family)
MAADDVAAVVCGVALAPPLNRTIDIGGPEALTFEEFIGKALHAVGDHRVVVTDPGVRYYGARLSERSLLPGDDAQLGATRFDDWLNRQPARS